MSYLDWGQTVKNDCLDLFLGEKIREGSTREVYVSGQDDTRVIKVENAAYSFQNVAEWDAWLHVEGTKWAKWFAPCYSISACGTVLIQARTEPVKKLPKRLPEFFTDIKQSNFGMLNGRLVCHDYGYTRLWWTGLRNGKMCETSRL